MDRNRLSSSDLLQLRRRAEGVIRTTPDVLSTLPKKELQHLMQELQVYQVELDMQNEELRRANVELEAARTKYNMLYEFAPSGYLTLAADGTVLETNLTAARLLGVERGALLQGRLALCVTSNDRPLLAAHLEQALASGHKETCELGMLQSGGVRWQARLESTRAPETVGPNHRCLVILIDITAQDQAQKQIAHLNAELTKQVKASETLVRTLEQSERDLQERNVDLERFQDVVVGRELKMMALERQIEELTRQLQRGKTEPGSVSD